MRAVFLVGLMSVCVSPACATSEMASVSRAMDLATTSRFAARLDAGTPMTPAAAHSKAVSLYESGDPPLPIPEVVANYQEVCADRARTRERRRAYDDGDDLARRQDCYCADSMPCRANRDCADLVLCSPQIARGDTSAAVGQL